jgi:SAM-dependent methyltransferase
MDNKQIYEKHDWEKLGLKTLQPKVEKVLEWIPDDVKTILDVGCGNGVITNILQQYFDVTAVDRSKKALSYVKTKKVEASADRIPLQSKQFDLVFSSEMLEHLDDKTFQGTLSEMKRLTKKYLFITVPNDENPDKLAIQCPSCGYVFNRPNHLRSFNLSSFRALFPEYRIIRSLAFGPKTRYYNPALLKAKIKLSPATAWVPYYWIPKNDRHTICPRCEHEFDYPYRFHPIASAIDMLNVVLSPKKPYWLFVLMEKK